MTDADKRRFVVVFNALAAAYRTQVTKPLLHAYYLGLRSLDLATVEAAIERGIQSGGGFLPTVAQLRSLVGEGHEQQLEAAWTWFLHAMRAVATSSDSVDLGPPLNATVRSLGGWEYVRSLHDKELNVFLRKRFDSVYPTYVSRDPMSYENTGSPLLHAFRRDRPVNLRHVSATYTTMRKNALARDGEAIAKLNPETPEKP